MGDRGRKSQASTAIAMLAEDNSGFTVINYPEPPYELSESEGFIWNAVVRDCTPDWFTPRSLALLKQYCRHVATADHIAQLIVYYREDMIRAMRGEATLKDLRGVDYKTLLMMQALESRTIAGLAVKMRIAQQSTIDPVSNNKPRGTKKPLWEI